MDLQVMFCFAPHLSVHDARYRLWLARLWKIDVYSPEVWLCNRDYDRRELEKNPSLLLEECNPFAQDFVKEEVLGISALNLPVKIFERIPSEKEAEQIMKIGVDCLHDNFLEGIKELPLKKKISFVYDCVIYSLAFNFNQKYIGAFLDLLEIWEQSIISSILDKEWVDEYFYDGFKSQNKNEIRVMLSLGLLHEPIYKSFLRHKDEMKVKNFCDIKTAMISWYPTGAEIGELLSKISSERLKRRKKLKGDI